jgi:hypothetical protein
MKAMNHLLSIRSELGLYGSLVNTTSGAWVEQFSSIGAGSDSFYEYIYKSYVLLDLHYSEFLKVSPKGSKKNYLFPDFC